MPPKSSAKKYTNIIAESELLLGEEINRTQEQQDERQEEASKSSPSIPNKIFKQQIANLRGKSHGDAVGFLNHNSREFIGRLSVKYLNLDYVSLQAIANLLITIEHDPLVALDDSSKKFMASLILRQTFARIMTTPSFKNVADRLLGRSLPGGGVRAFTVDGENRYESRVEFLQHYLEYIGPDHAASLLKEDCHISFTWNLESTPRSTKPSDKMDYLSIAAKADPVTTTLLRKIPKEDMSGLFATVFPYLNDADALRIVTTPVTKIKSLAADVRNVVKALATYGLATFVELAADEKRTLPRIIASNHPNISPDLVQFLLEKNISPKVLHKIALDHTFTYTLLHKTTPVLTVLALNCVEHPENFTKLYRKIHSELTDDQKIRIYLEDSLAGKESFASIAAEQYPDVFKQILVDLTGLLESGKIKPAALDKFLKSNNKNLVATAVPASERTPLLSSSAATSADAFTADERAQISGATTESTETDSPQDYVANRRYTIKTVGDLVAENQTAEAQKFKEVCDRFKQVVPASSAGRPAARAAKASSAVCVIS